MKKIITFTEYLNENDGGGGVAFATPNSNGAGNIVAPTVGTTPGSVNQAGSGEKGSGDVASYDYGKKFLYLNKDQKKKTGKKRIRKEKPMVFKKQSMPW